MLNLYHISQDSNEDYDTFTGAVVAAASEAEARDMDPQTGLPAKWPDPALMDSDDYDIWDTCAGHWCSSPSEVSVTLIGAAAPHITASGIILASFAAG